MSFPVVVWLDIVLASVVAALLVSFATAERAREAARLMTRRRATVRIGLLVVGVGQAILSAALVLEGVGAAPGASRARLVGTPLVAAGVVCIASATWRRGDEAPASRAPSGWGDP